MEGNNKAMREALLLCYRVIHCAMVAGVINRDDANKAMDAYHAALSKPPRNCDRFANEAEARKAFIVWYNTVYGLNGDKWHEVSSCDLKHNIDDILHDYIEWLYAPATEQGGETNGRK